MDFYYFIKFYLVLATVFIVYHLPAQTKAINNPVFDSLINVYKTSGSDTGKVRSLIEAGQYIYSEMPDSAIALWKKAIVIADRCLINKNNSADEIKKLKLSKASAINDIGFILYSYGMQQKATELFLVSLKIKEEYNDKSGISESYNNLAVVYEGQNELDKSLAYNLKSLRIRKENNDLEGLAISYNNIGVIYSKKKEINKAIDNYKKSLDIYLKMKDSSGIIYENSQIAYNLLYSNIKNENEEGLRIAQMAKNYYVRNNRKGDLQQTLNHISAYYYRMYKFDNALPLLEEGYELSKLNRNITSNLTTIRMLYSVYKGLEKPQNALEMLEEANKLQDSLRKMNDNKAILEIKFQKEYELKERTLKLEQENEARLKAEEDKKIKIIIGCILIFLILIFRRIRIKKFANIVIKTQEEEKIRISRELHDDLGQQLSYFRINYPLPDDAKKTLDEIIEKVRNISYNLRPVKINKNHIKELLEQLIKGLRTEIYFSYEIDQIDNLSSEQKMHLYRIAQEAINNILKHSKAKNARLTFLKQGDHLILEIMDDGVGYKINFWHKSVGLNSMQERANLINAKFKMHNLEKGTKITITLKNG